MMSKAVESMWTGMVCYGRLRGEWVKLFHLQRIYGKHLVNIIAFHLLKQWFVIK